MRFATLGSGSKGNASVIEHDDALVILDCGFAMRELSRRLELLNRCLADISAVIVTHEHSDHCKGVGALARHLNCPIYMTPGTHLAKEFGRIPSLNLITGYQPFTVGDIHVCPIAVPHDAREPAQFIFRAAETKLGVLTDLGSITPHVVAAYSGCSGLILEANHDPEMLQVGPYPWSLKQRVGGDWGHLSNQQALDFLSMADLTGLQQLVIGHMSEKNNSVDIVERAFKDITNRVQVHIARQGEPSAWFCLDA